MRFRPSSTLKKTSGNADGKKVFHALFVTVFTCPQKKQSVFRIMHFVETPLLKQFSNGRFSVELVKKNAFSKKRISVLLALELG